MSAPQQLSTSPVIEFGPYRLFSSARRLEKDGAPVKIGSRALDILICLAEQPGRPVSNKTLIKRVWRDMVVEEISLRVNIAGLRQPQARPF
ncbi:winged helix-turn-helix domain-containing protein [Pseudoduganella sp. RAF53_2]|uniref:winged helix-turn-helix domain-containing protein n=1 Tax=unclassified Pseudoduganella TaxID=2637179 RepID=UPI003F9B138A